MTKEQAAARYYEAKLVRLARENPDESSETLAEWARDEIADECANDVGAGDRDEPKDHAYNDCYDRHNPACAWAF